MALHLAICLPLYATVLPRRAALGSAAAAELPPPAPPAIAPAQRRTIFLLMAPGFAISGFISWGMSLHMVALLIGMGLSAATALVLGSSIGALQVAGRVVDYRWGGKLTPDRMGLISATVLLLAFPLIFAGFGVPAIALIFVVLYSLATANWRSHGRRCRSMFRITAYGTLPDVSRWSRTSHTPSPPSCLPPYRQSGGGRRTSAGLCFGYHRLRLFRARQSTSQALPVRACRDQLGSYRRAGCLKPRRHAKSRSVQSFGDPHAARHLRRQEARGQGRKGRGHCGARS